MNFQSERLLFREFKKDDYHLFSSVFSNEEVMKYAYMDVIKDENEMTEYFEKVMSNNENTQKRDAYEFAVFAKNDEKFMGIAGILIDYHFSRVKHGEIGYFLLPQYWDKGYATETAKTLTDVCFRELKIHKVVASCNAKNARSEKIMKKIGMIKEGELRKERFKDGNWENELRYSVLIEEWEDRLST